MKYEFPKITRARLKTINADSKTVGDGSTDDPTEEEKAWIDIMKSNAPEMETLKKKISVCALADVIEYDRNAVKFNYDGALYVVKKPTNSLQIARAYERSKIDALEVLNSQLCICKGSIPISKDFADIPVEVVGLLASVAENFFFAPYL